jgi:hypothetical protein
MTCKERVLAAVSHTQPGCNIAAVIEATREFNGLQPREIYV